MTSTRIIPNKANKSNPKFRVVISALYVMFKDILFWGSILLAANIYFYAIYRLMAVPLLEYSSDITAKILFTVLVGAIGIPVVAGLIFSYLDSVRDRAISRLVDKDDAKNTKTLEGVWRGDITIKQEFIPDSNEKPTVKDRLGKTGIIWKMR